MPPYGIGKVGAVTCTLLARQVASQIYEFRADIQVDSMVQAANAERSIRGDMIEAFQLSVDDYERKIAAHRKTAVQR